MGGFSGTCEAIKINYSSVNTKTLKMMTDGVKQGQLYDDNRNEICIALLQVKCAERSLRE